MGESPKKIVVRHFDPEEKIGTGDWKLYDLSSIAIGSHLTQWQWGLGTVTSGIRPSLLRPV